jgi:hypothetical protein
MFSEVIRRPMSTASRRSATWDRGGLRRSARSRFAIDSRSAGVAVPHDRVSSGASVSCASTRATASASKQQRGDYEWMQGGDNYREAVEQPRAEGEAHRIAMVTLAARDDWRAAAWYRTRVSRALGAAPGTVKPTTPEARPSAAERRMLHMPEHPLAGCVAKLNRAEDQLHLVKDAINEFLTSGFLELAPDIDRRGRLVARVREVRDPGERLSLLIGECAYSLRSALDHLSYQLALVNVGQPLSDRAARASAFPIYGSGPKYKRHAAAKVFAMSRGAQTEIERLQPYHRRKNPDAVALLVLDELCNVDKHRMLHPTGAMLVGSQFQLQGTGFFELRSIEVFPRILKSGAMLARFTGRFEDDVTITSHMRHDVVFGRDCAAPSARQESVLGALVAIRDFVAMQVMPRLASHFPGEYVVSSATSFASAARCPQPAASRRANEQRRGRQCPTAACRPMR